jgi:hypothetical protein
MFFYCIGNIKGFSTTHRQFDKFINKIISFGETLFTTWLAYWLFRLHFVGPQLEGPFTHWCHEIRTYFLSRYAVVIWGSHLQISAQRLAILTDSGCPQSLR